MLLAVDVSLQGGPAPTGVERAQATLLDALLARDDDCSWLLVSPGTVPAPWRDHPRVLVAEATGGPVWWWRETALPGALRRHRADLLHAPVAALPWRAPCPAIASLHELPWAEPGEHGGDARRTHRLRTARALRRAAALVVPSERTAAQVRRLHPAAAPRLHVVPHPVDPRFAPRPTGTRAELLAGLGLDDGPYLLAVGRLRRKKNLAPLLEALVAPPLAGPAGPRLLLAGPDGDAAPALAARAAAPDLAGRVHRLGHVDDGTLAELYRHAGALVFPSLIEGFGLPVLEALACACPVVASRQGAVPEAGEDAVLRVDGTDARALAAAVVGLLGDPALRGRLAERGLALAARRGAAVAAEAITRLYAELLP